MIPENRGGKQLTDEATTTTERQQIIRAPLRAGGSVVAIIPQDIDQVWRIAGMAVAGRMAPQSLVQGKQFEDAQAACAIAIMAGAELGMTPLTALRSYAVVNGRPSLWGDGIKSVVRASGKCEFIRSGGDLDKGWCTAKRKDTGEEMTREFTWAQAKKAHLDTKNGPWQEYPDMMMERRATFRCLNDLFADVLGGLADASDPIDPEDMRDVTPVRAERLAPPPPADDPAPPPPSNEPEKIIETTKAEPFENPEEPDATDPEPGDDLWFAKLEQFAGEAKTTDDLASVASYFDLDDVDKNAPLDVSARATQIMDKAKARIERASLEAEGQGDMLATMPEATRAAVKAVNTP